MAKGVKNKIESYIGRSRKFSVKRTPHLKPTSHYRLKQAYPSKFTIYREEPKKSFFAGRTIEHHAYRITILVIALAITTVFIGFIYMLDHPPERQVKDKIDELARTYYEENFYPNLANSDSFDGNFEKALSRYADKGLSRVYLRQFLLLEDVDEKTADFLKQYCNENSTYIRFFPEPPYSRDSYHTEITYSCNFE